jgi:hypothetical protein
LANLRLAEFARRRRGFRAQRRQRENTGLAAVVFVGLANSAEPACSWAMAARRSPVSSISANNA